MRGLPHCLTSLGGWPGLAMSTPSPALRLRLTPAAVTCTSPRSTKIPNTPLLGPAKNFVPRTAIAKIGDYVELFFTRTAPIFYWWSAMWQSTVDRQKAETVGLINDSLKRSLSDLTVTPTVSPTTAR